MNLCFEVACLDRFYIANITKNYKIRQVAQKILELSFDDRVQKDDISLIEDIASFGRGKKKHKYYHLLTSIVYYTLRQYIKKMILPIVYSIAKTKLKELYDFASKFSKKDLADYKKCKEIFGKV